MKLRFRLHTLICRMKILIIFWFITFYVVQSIGMIKDVSPNQNHSKIAKYISFLIDENNKRDPSQRHDVFLFHLNSNKSRRTESSQYEIIYNEIMKENPFNPILTHDSQKRLFREEIFEASIVIIVFSDKYLANFKGANFIAIYGSEQMKFFTWNPFFNTGRLSEIHKNLFYNFDEIIFRTN
ncbi:CLUMA_CG001900, isoform A [Clunio marinus]|uniref:CLUMA_CG001900, isoform A n=1 Tax=Clunio marinus TaxID=568069 RepID=A0A1J1HJM7_9DIPT|nr:CLUMA_CG001900, isoform A [Clunio marinus]